MTNDDVKPMEVLLIEDNEGDIFLTQQAFKEANIPTHLSVAKDGEEGLDFLYKRGQFATAPTPHIILLDINMPKKSGQEVLATIKEDESLRSIPVIMLTTSDSHADILNSYNLKANSYIKKPVDFLKFVEVVKNIETFWFSSVQLPDRET